MTPAAWLLLGYGAAVTAALIILWRALEAAHNRLYAAQREGFVLPPPEVIPPPPAKPLEDELEQPLLEWLEQWEGDEARTKWLARIRTLRAKGLTVKQILSELDQPAWT